MRFLDVEFPFDPTNRAFRSFLADAVDRFTVTAWHTDDTDRPVMLTLADPVSGDAFTLAVMDSVEVRDPHVLLRFTTDAALAGHGVFKGRPSADFYARHLAMSDTTECPSRAVPLHHPDQPLPADTWLVVPAYLARAAHPAAADTATATAVVLIDRDRGVLTAVGPFPTRIAATEWRPAPHTPHADAERLVVAVHRPKAHRPH